MITEILCADNKQIIVAIRCDDISPGKGRQFDIIKKLIDLSDKYKIPQTFAVVPIHYKNAEIMANDEITPLLKKACSDGIIEIALHGFDHKDRNVQGLRAMLIGVTSEFCGASYEEQFSRMVEGKRLLEENIGCGVNTFIPPWDTYDSCSIKAMKDADMNIVSSSYQIISTSGYRLPPPIDITYLHCDCSLSDFAQVLDFARKRNDKITFVVVGYHWWALPQDLSPIKNVMDIINSSSDIKSLTMTEADNQYHDLLEKLNKSKYESVYFMRHASVLLQLPVLKNINNILGTAKYIEVRGLFDTSHYVQGKKIALIIMLSIYISSFVIASITGFLISLLVAKMYKLKGIHVLTAIAFSTAILFFLCFEAYFAFIYGHKGYSIKDCYILLSVGFFLLLFNFGLWRNYKIIRG